MIAFVASALASPVTDEIGGHATWLGGALTTEAVGTVELRAWRSRPHLAFGGGLDLPVTLWAATGVPDTLRGSGSAEVLLVEHGPWVVTGGGATRLGVQRDGLGTLASWDVAPTAFGGLRGRPGHVGAGLRWEQPLASAIWFSEDVERAFEGSSTPPPRDGVVPLGIGRLAVGVDARLSLSPRVAVVALAEGLITPDRVALEWDEELVMGVWPGRFALGLVGAISARRTAR